MARYRPAYRLVVRKPRRSDATETAILVPRAGAAHAEPFRVATHALAASHNLYVRSEPTQAEIGSAGGYYSGSLSAATLDGFDVAHTFAAVAPAVSDQLSPGALSLTAGTRYVLSVYVRMLDNSAPRIGVRTDAAKDFALVIENAERTAGLTITPVPGEANLYRCSVPHTAGATATSANHGIWRYSGQSAKGFTVAGWQMHVVSSGGLPGRYAKTTGAALSDESWRPYLALPRGRRGQIDAATAKLDIGMMALELADARVTAGGSNLQRWVTAFVGDAQKSQQLAGCKVTLEECLDFDPVLQEGVFRPLMTGRIRKSAMQKKLRWTFTVRELSDDLKMPVHVGSPHSSIAYARMTHLWPLGVPVDYGPWVAAVGTGTTVAAPGGVFTNACTGHLNVPYDYRAKWHTKRYYDMVWREVFAVPTDTEYQGRLVRLVVQRTDTLEVREFVPVPYLWSGSTAGYDTIIDGWEMKPLAGGAAAFPAGVPIAVYVRVVNTKPTEELPLFIGNVHPVQRLKDLFQGKFSRLDTAGAVTAAMPINEASFDTLIADPSFVSEREPITKPEPLNVVAERIMARHRLGYRLDGAGRVVLVDLRSTAAWASSGAITDADLVDGGDEEWEHDGDEALSRIAFTLYREAQVAATELGKLTWESTGFRGMVDAPSTLLTREPLPVRYIDMTGVIPGGEAKDATIDGTAWGFVDGEVASDGTSRQARVERAGDKLRAELRGPFANGPAFLTVSLKRSVAVLAGQFCTVTLSAVPNPDTNERGGTRRCLMVSRIEDGPRLRCTFLDLGADLQALTPTYTAFAKNVATPRHAIDLGVNVNAAQDVADVWVAITETSVTVRPAETSSLWMPLAWLAANTSRTYGELPSRRHIWIRARSMPGVGSPLKAPSAWVYPDGFGFGAYVALDSIGSLSLPVITELTSAGGVVSWTSPDANYRVEVYLAINQTSAPTPWTAAYRIATLPPGSTRVLVRGAQGPSANNYVGLRLVDDFGGDTPFLDVSLITNAAVPAAPRVAGFDAAIATYPT